MPVARGLPTTVLPLPARCTRTGTKPGLVAGVGKYNWDRTDGLGIDEYVVKFSINSAAFVDDNWLNAAGPVTETGLNTGDTVVAEVFARNSTGMYRCHIQHRECGRNSWCCDWPTFTEEDGVIGLRWFIHGWIPSDDYIIESTADGGAGSLSQTSQQQLRHDTATCVLVNGNEYSFRVSEDIDCHRCSTEISGGPAVPHTVPSAPVLSKTTSGNGSIGITWSAPDNGGKPITDYVVQYKRVSNTMGDVY